MSSRVPPSVWILIILNSLLYFIPQIITVTIGGQSYNLYQVLVALGAKENNAILQGGEWYRLISSAFLHGSPLHLFMNMYALYAVGPAVIGMFRTSGFWIIYIFGAIAGSLGSLGITHYLGQNTLSVGASGAIFALIGASLVYFLVTKNRLLQREFLMIIGLNLLIGFVPGTNIDNWAHLGGLVGGIIIGAILPKNRQQLIDEV